MYIHILGSSARVARALAYGDISWQIHYGRYITADILRQMYYGRYYTADTLWPLHCVHKKRPYLGKFPAPEALDCCIRICLLQRIAPTTGLDCFMMYTSRTEPFLIGHRVPSPGISRPRGYP